MCVYTYMQQATDSILWKRLNWLPTFIYVVKLDKDKIEERKEGRMNLCLWNKWDKDREKLVALLDNNSNKDTQSLTRYGDWFN